ncbi:hypothetical protein HDU96_010756 [Phlyctochytrium bullatum]|nr:hypothetical protein HDU96_010756 [Phlyctochytrium bullatum]
MAEVRNRKAKTINDREKEDEADKKIPKAVKAQGGVCFRLILALVGLVFLALGVSFIVTETFTFGLKVPNLRKYLPVSVLNYKFLGSVLQRKEITLTTAELAQYDGSDPNKPIYLAIK